MTAYLSGVACSAIVIGLSPFACVQRAVTLIQHSLLPTLTGADRLIRSKGMLSRGIKVTFIVSTRATTCCVLGLRAEVDPVRQQGVVSRRRCGIDA